ncbi:MAG: YcxB family protein [Candidatus Merdivicinus sp.]|jgi:hypothetical protein
MEEKERETTLEEVLEEEKDLDSDSEQEEPEQKILPEQGLDTEKYEVSEPWLDGRRIDDSVEGLKIEYNLRREEVVRALKYFQKRTIYRKNTIFTVILAIIAVFYAQAIYTDPQYTLGYLMLVLSLAVIWFLWFLPARHIKAAADAVELSQDNYQLEFCPEGLIMPQSDGRYLVGFDRPSVRAVEFPEYYLLIVSREKVFALPKRCIPEEDQETLSGIFREALGARYEIVTE